MNRFHALILTLGILLLSIIWIDHQQKQKVPFTIPKSTNPIVHFNNIPYLHVREIQKQTSLQSKIDPKNKTISLKNGEQHFYFVDGNPVIKHNGTFRAMKGNPIVKNGDAWLPAAALQQINQLKKEISVAHVNKERNKIKKMSVGEMSRYLSFLETPIPGAHVSKVDSSLPGANRGYRNGFHEGLDWYSFVCGITINEKTKVYSVAEGTVVRVDHHYKELSTKERKALLKIAGQEEKTPEYILDKLRGRSVWIQHKKGVLCRYVHLSSVNPKLKMGSTIKAGEYLGNVGNSGTSHGAANKKEGLHLHLDILLYGDWFWDQYTTKERRKILETIFDPKVC